jgi:hypothetical protein
LVRWRTQAMHHDIQGKGRTDVFLDYHLRVGQITQDTHLPDGYALQEQRLDETVAGDGTTVMMVDVKKAPERLCQARADEVAQWLGLVPDAAGLVSWDVFDAVLTPGDLILLMTWRDKEAAQAYQNVVDLPAGARLRRVRIVRDYGMYDRRESPQYYPDAIRQAV